jgi:hypothetical protein
MGDIPKKLMHIGKVVLAKHEGKIQEFAVKEMTMDTLYLIKGDVEIIRYFWEVRPVPETKDEE